MTKKNRNTSAKFRVHLSQCALDHFTTSGFLPVVVGHCAQLGHKLRVWYNSLPKTKLAKWDNVVKGNLYIHVVTNFLSDMADSGVGVGSASRGTMLEILIVRNRHVANTFDVIVHIFLIDFDLVASCYQFLLPFPDKKSFH